MHLRNKFVQRNAFSIYLSSRLQGCRFGRSLCGLTQHTKPWQLAPSPNSPDSPDTSGPGHAQLVPQALSGASSDAHHTMGSGARWDAAVLFLTRTVRMLAYGSTGVVLALFLSAVGLSGAQLRASAWAPVRVG